MTGRARHCDGVVTMIGMERPGVQSPGQVEGAAGVESDRSLMSILAGGDAGSKSDSSLDVIGLMQQVRVSRTEDKLCKYSHWFWLDPSTGEKSPFCCGSWSCVRCRHRLAGKWAHRFIKGNPTAWFTVTNVPSDRQTCRLKWQQFMRAIRSGYGRRRETMTRFLEVAQWIAGLMRQHVSASQWARLALMLRRGFPLAYARVLERGGKNGMRHFHVLYRCRTRIPHLIVVTLAHIFGFGHVGHESEIYSEGGSWYVAKYLGKSGGEAGWRKVTVSRGQYPWTVKESHPPSDLVLVSPGIYRSGVPRDKLAALDRYNGAMAFYGLRYWYLDRTGIERLQGPLGSLMDRILLSGGT